MFLALALSLLAADQIAANDTELKEKKKNSETVIIKAKKISKPFSNVTFSKLDVYLNPSAKADPILGVADLPFATNNNNSAEINLRGGSYRLSRVYFNDVPFYEIVRGNNLLTTTQGFSIFNNAMIDQVETYSTAPPSYFTNTAGGVIRILPPENSSKGGQLNFNLVKSGFYNSIPLKNKNGFIQYYGDYADLSPLMLINKNLRKSVDYSKGGDLGVNSLFLMNDGTQVRFFSILDTESGKFNFDLSDKNNLLGNIKNRNYNVLSIEKAIGANRIKIDIAKSFVNQTTKMNNDFFENKNQYNYIDINLASKLKKLPISYRVGLDFEEFDLKSIASINRPERNLFIKPIISQNPKYSSYYGFLTYSHINRFSFAIGYRDYIDNKLDLPKTAQISASLTGNKRRNSFVLSYGNYGSVVLPLRSAFEKVTAAKSEQASFDYKYTYQNTKITAGLYQKIETIENQRMKINGFDASIGFTIFNNTEISANYAKSFSHYNENGIKQTGDNDLDYLFKLKAKINFTGINYMNFYYTAMSGQTYSLPIGTQPDIIGDMKPIYNIRNNYNLKDYQSLDFSYVKQVKLFKKINNPIIYININNLLDTKNQSNIEFEKNYTKYNFRNYIGRTIVVGGIWDF